MVRRDTLASAIFALAARDNGNSSIRIAADTCSTREEQCEPLGRSRNSVYIVSTGLIGETSPSGNRSSASVFSLLIGQRSRVSFASPEFKNFNGFLGGYRNSQGKGEKGKESDAIRVLRLGQRKNAGIFCVADM